MDFQSKSAIAMSLVLATTALGVNAALYAWIQDIDHMFWMAAVLLLAGMTSLTTSLKEKYITDGVSMQMLVLFALGLVARLSNTLFFPNYIPDDFTAYIWFYQLVELATLYQVAKAIYLVRNDQRETLIPTMVFIAFAVILAMVTKSNANENIVMDGLWMFSIWIETLALIPQLLLSSGIGSMEPFMNSFIIFMAASRCVSCFLWINAGIKAPFFFFGIQLSNCLYMFLCLLLVLTFINGHYKGHAVLPERGASGPLAAADKLVSEGVKGIKHMKRSITRALTNTSLNGSTDSK